MEINGDTQLCGILGWPVGHSLSPVMHNAAFRARRMNAVYLPFPVEKPRAGLKSTLLDLQNFRGLSVTIPHKVWAARIADKADALTVACGAANTLVPKDGELHAHNTDGAGALEALRRNADVRGKRVLIIGYGGSAAAIAHALLLDGKPAALLVAGRNKKSKRRFVESLRTNPSAKRTLLRVTEWDDLEADDVDVIIQTTPLGMVGKAKELPLPEEFVQQRHLVFDIVYNPARTPLVDLATRRRATLVPGYLMLLYQAVAQFTLFTGETAPESIMEKELLAAIRRLK